MVIVIVVDIDKKLNEKFISNNRKCNCGILRKYRETHFCAFLMRNCGTKILRLIFSPDKWIHYVDFVYWLLIIYAVNQNFQSSEISDELFS